MRTRFLLTLALCLGVALLAAGPSQGQGARGRPNYGPGYRPGLSPYLNLLRGGDIASNYYLGVLAEIDRRNTQQVFRRQINTLEEEVTRVEEKEEEFSPSTSKRDTFGRSRLNRMFGGSTAPTRSSSPGPSGFPAPRGRR